MCGYKFCCRIGLTLLAVMVALSIFGAIGSPNWAGIVAGALSLSALCILVFLDRAAREKFHWYTLNP
jgi:hypothetical protein